MEENKSFDQDFEPDKPSSSGFGHCESEYESVGEGDDDFNLSNSKDISEDKDENVNKTQNLRSQSENLKLNQENLDDKMNEKNLEVCKINQSNSNEIIDNFNEEIFIEKSLKNLIDKKSASHDQNTNNQQDIKDQDLDENEALLENLKLDGENNITNANELESKEIDQLNNEDEQLIHQKMKNISLSTEKIESTAVPTDKKDLNKFELVNVKIEENIETINDKISSNSVNIEAKIKEDNSEINDDDDDEYEDVESKENENEAIKEDMDDDIPKEDYKEAENNLSVNTLKKQEDEEENNEESQQPTELDDDEDRRNPQYIPKRGAFYEHDDRMVGEADKAEEVKEEIVPEKEKKVEKGKEVEVKRNKKIWSADSKWGHDLFNESDQKPKSRDEVISTYGYDIRNEEGPPKARRNKKYGRGPNKYTRNWQDEDAYSRGLKSQTTNQNRHKRSHRHDKKKTRSDKTVQKQQESSNKQAATKILDDKDFPELPSKNRENKKSGSNILSFNDNHHQQQTPSTVWHKPKSKAFSENKFKDDFKKEFFKAESDCKTEPMKVIEAIEKNKRGFTLSSDSKIEIVKTQTFENSKYSNRRVGSNNNFVNRNDASLNKYQSKFKTGDSKTFNKELGRPITKNNYLTQTGSRSAGVNIETSKINNHRTRPNFERDFKEGNIVRENNFKDSRNSGENNGNRNVHKENNQNFIYREEPEISSNISKQNVEKANKNNELEFIQQLRPKRYSSLRQHQQPRSLSDQNPLSASVVTQFQSNSPHLAAVTAANVNQRQAGSANQYFKPMSENQSPNFYHEPRSSSATFAYISPTTIEPNPTQTSPHTARFLSQIAPRFLPQSASPSSGTERFIPQSSLTPPSASQTAPSLPPVITAAATTPYLPTYPPGYPQFPPPPPPPPTHYHSLPAPPPPPPPPPSANEMYRGGVTYYDTAQQKVSPRQLPQRRPKNAIPIVPPPETGPTGFVDGYMGYLHHGVVEAEVNPNLEINS